MPNADLLTFSERESPTSSCLLPGCLPIRYRLHVVPIYGSMRYGAPPIARVSCLLGITACATRVRAGPPAATRSLHPSVASSRPPPCSPTAPHRCPPAPEFHLPLSMPRTAWLVLGARCICMLRPSSLLPPPYPHPALTALSTTEARQPPMRRWPRRAGRPPLRASAPPRLPTTSCPRGRARARSSP